MEFISHIVGCLSGRVLWAADSAAREREIWKPPARSEVEYTYQGNMLSEETDSYLSQSQGGRSQGSVHRDEGENIILCNMCR